MVPKRNSSLTVQVYIADGDRARGGGGGELFNYMKVTIQMITDLTAPQRMLAYLRLAQ